MGGRDGVEESTLKSKTQILFYNQFFRFSFKTTATKTKHFSQLRKFNTTEICIANYSFLIYCSCRNFHSSTHFQTGTLSSSLSQTHKHGDPTSLHVCQHNLPKMLLSQYLTCRMSYDVAVVFLSIDVLQLFLQQLHPQLHDILLSIDFFLCTLVIQFSIIGRS